MLENVSVDVVDCARVKDVLGGGSVRETCLSHPHVCARPVCAYSNAHGVVTRPARAASRCSKSAQKYSWVIRKDGERGARPFILSI